MTRGPQKADQVCSRSARVGGCFLQAFLVAGEESQGLSGLCLRKTPMKKRAPKILPGQEWSIGVTRFLFGKRKKKNHFLDTWATLQKRGPSSLTRNPVLHCECLWAFREQAGKIPFLGHYTCSPCCGCRGLLWAPTTARLALGTGDQGLD